MTPELEQQVLAFDKHENLSAQEMTGVVMTFLDPHGVKTQPYAGDVSIQDLTTVDIHFWLDLEDGRRIDLRLAKSLRNNTELRLPKGIFRPEDYPDVNYNGFPIKYAPLADRIYNILLGRDVLSE